MQISTRDAADRSRTSHQLVPGIGYVHCGGIPKINNPVDGVPVAPDHDAEDGSLHVLISAGGGEIVMRWRDCLWEHPNDPTAGNRLAHSPGFLGRAGWKYGRAS